MISTPISQDLAGVLFVRRNLVAEIVETLHKGYSVKLVGIPEIGITTVMKRFVALCTGMGELSQEFFPIYLAGRYDGNRVRNEILRQLRVEGFKVDNLPDQYLREILEEARRIVAGKKLLVICDDFEKNFSNSRQGSVLTAENITDIRDLAENKNSGIQILVNYRHPLNPAAGDDYYLNNLHTVFVDLLTLAEAKDLVASRWASENRGEAEEITELTLRYGGRHPQTLDEAARMDLTGNLEVFRDWARRRYKAILKYIQEVESIPLGERIGTVAALREIAKQPAKEKEIRQPEFELARRYCYEEQDEDGKAQYRIFSEDFAEFLQGGTLVKIPAMSPPSTAITPQNGETSLGIVLRGGGVKGLALLGAIAELESGLRVTPRAFGGTSAGGLLAIALAGGYSAHQLIPVIRNQSFLDFFDVEWSPDIYTEPWSDRPKKLRGFVLPLLLAGLLRVGLGCLGFRTRGGMYSSEPIGRWMLHLLRWRPQNGCLPPEPDLQTDTCLGALPLGVLTVASSTGAENSVMHSSVATPKVDACFAARCTMSIPGIFHPIPSGGDLLMDGGLVANFPLEQFVGTWPQARVLGVFLCDTESSARQRDWTTGPVGLVRASLAVFLGQDELLMVKENRESIVWIDVTPIQTLDFDLSDEDKELLLECGRVGAKRWLREHANDSIVSTDAVPTDQEFTECVEGLRRMRASARQRWHVRHRNRRFILALVLLIPVLLILTATLAGGFALSRLIQGSTERPNNSGSLAPVPAPGKL